MRQLENFSNLNLGWAHAERSYEHKRRWNKFAVQPSQFGIHYLQTAAAAR